MFLRAVLLLAACAAFSAAQAQTLFKCVGRDGKVTYQSEKCADAVRESTVKPPDPVAPRAAAPVDGPDGAGVPKGERAPSEPVVEWETFIAQISSYENCAVTVPGFGAKHAAHYKLWRERHRTASARFNQDGNAQRRVRESAEYVRGKMNERSAEQRQYDTETCENQVAAVFAPPNPPRTQTKN